MPNESGNKDNPFGLDYGPAPLDVKAAAENALKKGTPLSLEDLSLAAGRNVTADELDSAAKDVKSVNPFADKSVQLGQINQDKGYQPQSARQLVLDLAEQKGLTLGDALLEYNKIYDNNLASVRLLPDAAEVRQAMGGRLSRMGEAAVESAAKGPAYLGSKLLPEKYSGPFEEAYKGIEERQAEQPRGLFTAENLGNLIGYAADMEAIAPLTSAAVGAILPKVPWVIKGANTILESVRAGKPVTGLMLDSAEGALIRASRIGKLANEGAAFVTTDLARGESPEGSIGYLAGITGLKMAARFSGLAGLAAKIGLGKAADQIAGNYLMKATGKSWPEINALKDTGDNLLNTLQSMDAPPHIKQQVFNAASEEARNHEFAHYLGIKAGEWKATPEQLDAWIGGAPKEFQSAAKDGYNKATGNWRSAVKDAPISVVEQPVSRGQVDLYFTPLSQWARTAARVDQVSVAPRVFERPYTINYNASDMAAGKLPADLVVEQLAHEHPEGAKALQILHTPWGGSDGQAYNNMALEVAGKLAKDRGFGAIKVNGPTVAEDFVADLSRLKDVNLDKILENLNNRLPTAEAELVKGAPAIEPPQLSSVGAMEVPVPKSPLASEKPRPVPENPISPGIFRYNAKRDLANIERLKQRVAEAKNPDEANFAKKDLSVAVRSYQRDFPDKPNPLEPNASKIIGIKGNIPSGGVAEPPKVVFGDPNLRKSLSFIELITPKNESLLAAPSSGSMHSDLLQKTEYNANDKILSRMDLEGAIQQGYVRAGRDASGPFVEFNHDDPTAKARAADFIVQNSRKNDRLFRMDVWKGGQWKATAASDLTSALDKIESAAGYPWNVKRVTNMRDFLAAPLAIGAGAAAAAAYSMIEPDQAQASPLSEFFSKAIKEEGSEIVSKMAKAATEEDIVSAGKQAAAEAAAKATANADKVSTSDNVLNHAVAGTAPTEEGKRFLGLFGNNYGVKGGSRFRLVFDQTDHPLVMNFWARFMDDKDIMLTGVNSVSNQLVNKSGDILKLNNINPIEDSKEFIRAFEGLQMTPDGWVHQVFTDLKPNIAKAASEMRTEVWDPVFEQVKGVSVQAHQIAAKYGMKDEPQTWTKLKWLQDVYDPLDPKNNSWRGKFPTVDERQAALETKGMLNFTDANDLDIKYNEGQFTILPVKYERSIVTNRMKALIKEYPNGLPSDKVLEMDALNNRVAQLDAAEAAAKIRKPPDMTRLKRRQNFGPISEDQIDIPEISREKDLRKVLGYHINGVVNKSFWDHKLTAGRKLAANLENYPYKLQSGEVINPDPYLASKVVGDLNALRGLRSIQDDQGFANAFNDTFRALGVNKQYTIREIQDMQSNIGWFQYITKVALNPGFPIMNIGQPSLTTSVVTGWRHLYNGYAKALTDWGRAYKEALEAGVLKFESGYVQEIDRNKYLTPLENAADWLPSRTENFNRVATFHAAKSQALEEMSKGNFRVPLYVKLFDRSLLETGTEKQIADAYAKAVVRTTQFMFGPEGKPEILIGGGFRRIAGQFKSFTAGYLTLAKDVLKHTAQTKDPRAFARLIGSLMFFGGGSAVVGSTIYDLVRHEALKYGIPLPSGSLLGEMVDRAGQVYPLNEHPDVRDAINSIQASGRFSPMNFPSGDQIVSWLLGPSLGSVFDAGGYAIGAATGKMAPGEASAKAVQSLFGPLAAKGPSMLQDFGVINDLGIGYRGGSYSPTGKLLSDKDTVLNLLARSFNMRPPVRVMRWEYLADLKSALEGGQMDMARDIIKKAERDRVLITASDVSGVMGKITRERRERMPNK